MTIQFIIFLLIIVLLVLITRPFTVIFHELGHAVPAILLTKARVTIYIGSYGDPKNSINFNIGLLEVWFKYNPFSWRSGLCIPHAGSVSINRKIIYTLAGPIASFAIAVIAIYFTFAYDLHGAIKLIIVVFLGSTIFDLFINLIPQTDPIKLFDGSIIHNDGYVLKQFFYYKKFSRDYSIAVENYKRQEYGDAAKQFDKILKNELIDENLYRLAISSYLQIKNYERVTELNDRFILFFELNPDDLSNAGIAYSFLGLHDKALEYYDKSLELNPRHKNALNNKGYTFNLLEKYHDAIPYFDKAIEVDHSFAYSYNNRGLAKIKLGNAEGGLEDINLSFKLDSCNSYGYRNLGIYHLDEKEYDEALRLFMKAKNLDASTHMIDELISTAEFHINNHQLSNPG